MHGSNDRATKPKGCRSIALLHPSFLAQDAPDVSSLNSQPIAFVAQSAELVELAGRQRLFQTRWTWTASVSHTCPTVKSRDKIDIDRVGKAGRHCPRASSYFTRNAMPNLLLYTREALQRDPKEFSGIIMALRFGFKSEAGFSS
jgi:hypothetical protein